MLQLAITILALFGAASAYADAPKVGDMVNNPPFVHWSQFPVGTAVTTREVVTLADGGAEEVVATAKLIAKAKDHVTVETVVTGGEVEKKSGAVEQTKTVTDFPAQVKFEKTQGPDTAGYSVTEGKEVVDVKGKEVATEWIEATATNGDETIVEKTWAAQDVPGGIVKQTITKKKAGKVVTQSTLDVVAVQPGPGAKKKK